MPPESLTVTDLCELLRHEARCLPLEIEGHLGRDLAQAGIIYLSVRRYLGTAVDRSAQFITQGASLRPGPWAPESLSSRTEPVRNRAQSSFIRRLLQ